MLLLSVFHFYSYWYETFYSLEVFRWLNTITHYYTWPHKRIESSTTWFSHNYVILNVDWKFKKLKQKQQFTTKLTGNPFVTRLCGWSVVLIFLSWTQRSKRVSNCHALTLNILLVCTSLNIDVQKWVRSVEVPFYTFLDINSMYYVRILGLVNLFPPFACQVWPQHLCPILTLSVLLHQEQTPTQPD